MSLYDKFTVFTRGFLKEVQPQKLSFRVTWVLGISIAGPLLDPLRRGFWMILVAVVVVLH